MHHFPKPIVSQYFCFCCSNGNEHNDDQWNGSKSREQTKQNKRTTKDLERTNKWPKEFRVGEADLSKATCSQLIRKQKFLNALREKNCSYHESDKKGCRSSISRYYPF